jgi:histidinol-phosphate phosphatase family protein
VLQSNVKNGSIHGFINDGYFIDIGIPEDFARANNEFDHFYKLNNLDLSGYDTLFLDRDGVINRLRPNDYVKSWSEFEFLPGVFEALAKFSKQFKRIFIITNQRGVGRGLMSEDDLNEIHRRMVAEIVKQGGRIDKIYYCTDVSNLHPNRKPNIGMALQAQHDYPEIDFSKSLMIGDSEGDMAFAKNSKMNSIKI